MDDVPGPKGFEDVPTPALKVLLGVGKQEHENQSNQDTSGYNLLHHGCYSMGLASRRPRVPRNIAHLGTFAGGLRCSRRGRWRVSSENGKREGTDNFPRF